MEPKAYSMVISFGILFKVQVPVSFLYFSESSTCMVLENMFWVNKFNPVDNLHFSANSLVISWRQAPRLECGEYWARLRHSGEGKEGQRLNENSTARQERGQTQTARLGVLSPWVAPLKTTPQLKACSMPGSGSGSLYGWNCLIY